MDFHSLLPQIVRHAGMDMCVQSNQLSQFHVKLVKFLLLTLEQMLPPIAQTLHQVNYNLIMELVVIDLTRDCIVNQVICALLLQNSLMNSHVLQEVTLTLSQLLCRVNACRAPRATTARQAQTH